MNITAEVDYDHQHGPIVRTQVNDIVISVYIADETAVVTTDKGQYGLQVTGPWVDFRKGIREATE